MTALTWDQAGSRTYENGVERGVLYLSDGSAVPWNGLKSVTENFNKTTSPIYYDGVKINEGVVLGEFSASLKAITYPDEFLEYEGVVEIAPGAFLGDQKPKLFGLSYRTSIGNDLSNSQTGYKIHVLYNLTATPSPINYESQGAEANLIDFEWTLTSIPVEVEWYNPTAHIILDSRTLDSWTLSYIEDKLYGTSGTDASLIPLPDLVELIALNINIIDNGDGTWTARAYRSGFITDNGDGTFNINNVVATFPDATTYTVSDTPI